MKNILGINWNLKYRLEKGKNEILRMKIDILRKRLSKYENYNTRPTGNREDNNVIEFSRPVYTKRD
jgi:hypothetical protein